MDRNSYAVEELRHMDEGLISPLSDTFQNRTHRFFEARPILSHPPFDFRKVLLKLFFSCSKNPQFLSFIGISIRIAIYIKYFSVLFFHPLNLGPEPG